MRYFLFILVLGCNLTMKAQSPEETFAQGLQMQTNGNLAKSIELYESIIDAPSVSATTHNNLALAYIKNKQLGKGILHLERALKLDQYHADAKHNLQAANQRIVVPIPSSEAVFFVRWWNGIVQAVSSTTWAILFLVIFGGGLAAIATWRWQAVSKYRNWGILLLLFSSLPLLWGFQQKAYELDNSPAIIIKKEVGIRQDPALKSPEIEIIHEGIKVRILDQKENWVYVQLPNLLVGWIPAQMLERI